MKTKICSIFGLMAFLIALALPARADWILDDGTAHGTEGDGGWVTMTDSAAGITLRVSILDETARTLRLGIYSPNNTVACKKADWKYNSNACYNPENLNKPEALTGTLDFSQPIHRDGSEDMWTIVEIGALAFYNSKSITCPVDGLDLTTVTNVGRGAFSYASAMTKIRLSDKLQELHESAFNMASGVTSFEPFLPASLKKIGSGAFARQTANWDTSIVMNFSGTDGILEMRGIEAIEGSAFNCVYGVREVTLGPSLNILTNGTFGTIVNTMGDNYPPLGGLMDLESITFLGDKPTTLQVFYTRRGKKGNANLDGADNKVTAYFYEDYTNNWVTGLRNIGTVVLSEFDSETRVFGTFKSSATGNISTTIKLALLEGHPPSETEPVFDTVPTLEKVGSSFRFSGRLSSGRGTLLAVFTETDGSTEHLYPLTNSEVEGDADATVYSLVFDRETIATDLPQNKTYSFAIRGTNTQEEVSTRAGVGTFFFGAVKVAVDSEEVSENGGSLVYAVSRTGTDGELTVPLLFSGTATEGVNFKHVAHNVTIPNGSSSVSLTVTPVVALDTPTTTLSVAASGLACIFVGDSATATISDWDGPQLSEFARTMSFTAVGCTNAQANALSHFPVLLRIPAPLVASIGSDSGLAFFQGDELLPHEVDMWSAEDGARIWVGLSSLYTNAVVKCAWGKSGYAAPNLAYDLWREAGYVSVWHLSEDENGEVSLADVSINECEALANEKTASAGGAVGKGRTISAGSDYGWIDTPSPNTILLSPTTFTISFWQYALPSTDAVWMGSTQLLENDDPGWFLKRKAVSDYSTETVQVYGRLPQSGGSDNCNNVFSGVVTNTWAHYSLAAENGSLVAVERNGDVRAISLAYLSNSNPVVIGGFGDHKNGKSFRGSVDEIRVRNVRSSNAWLVAEFATVTDPNFMQAELQRGMGFLVY